MEYIWILNVIAMYVSCHVASKTTGLGRWLNVAAALINFVIVAYHIAA